MFRFYGELHCTESFNMLKYHSRFVTPGHVN